MHTIWRLVRLLRPFAWEACFAVFIGFLAMGANIGLMGTSGYLISSAALHPSTILLLWVPIVGVRFFGISRAALRYTERLVSHDVAFRVLTQCKVWIYQTLMHRTSTLWQKRRSGDLLGSIIADMDTLQDVYVRIVFPACVAVLGAALTIALVGRDDGRAALYLLGFFLLTGIGFPFAAVRLSQRFGTPWIKARADLYMLVTDTFAGIREILAAGLAPRFEASLAGIHRRMNGLEARLALTRGLFEGLSLMASQVAVFVVLYFIIRRVQSGGLPGVQVASLILVAMSGFEAVGLLAQAFQRLGPATEAARRLFSLEQLPCDPGLPQRPRILSAAPSLQVRDLSFRYPDGNRDVLRHIDLDVRPGEQVAIVGPSGAGKSTLFLVLTRMVDYTEGSVQLGGLELRDIGEDDIRSCLATVTQSTHLFHATVADNIRLGDPAISTIAYERAIEQSGLTRVLDRLPEQDRTLVGEFGTRLSGGERQRIALARALARKPAILLLDEPTASLDPLSEREFMRCLRGQRGNQTVLLITHRLIGLEWMDKIYVLDDGAVVECGSHKELLMRRGLYRAMWDVQREMLAGLMGSHGEFAQFHG
ncbi:MAG: thiol reductant ABC exporter subunit CydC [Alicyclobacillus sp.]|nr:thiol reductant ABC exporter subunit CydC [Alicyclobacillus sp.]